MPGGPYRHGCGSWHHGSWLTRPCLRPSSMYVPNSRQAGLRQALVRKNGARLGRSTMLRSTPFVARVYRSRLHKTDRTRALHGSWLSTRSGPRHIGISVTTIKRFGPTPPSTSAAAGAQRLGIGEICASLQNLTQVLRFQPVKTPSVVRSRSRYMPLVVSPSNHELGARPSTLREPQGRPEPCRRATSLS